MHSEKRGSWMKEGMITAFCGLLFGGANTLVGHPFDLVKTKMQAQKGHMAGESGNCPSYIQTIKNVFKQDGLLGFYKGWLPPFIGSIIFRSVQFSVYEMCFTKFEEYEIMKQKVPLLGMQQRVLIGGFIAGTIRSFIECPFEYAKVKLQTGQQWYVKDIYKGFTNLYPRSTGLMTIYFCMVDTLRRITNLWDNKLGQFLISGGSAMFGFWCIWPFEVLKNLAQAENKDAGNSTIERAKFIMRTQGIIGFYRGILPGSQSVFLRNGAAMIVMQYAQKKITQYGWRN